MQLNKTWLLALFGLILFMAPPTFAGPVIYQVTVNTSSAYGQSADLDLQFNGAALPYQSATATVLNFVTDGTLNPAVSDAYTGSMNNVSGMLPGAVTFGNSTSFDDYTENITFGNIITFDLVLDGDEIEHPDPAHNSGGSSFVLDFINANCTTSSCNQYFLVNDPNDVYSYTGWIAGLVNIEYTGSTDTMTNPGPNNTAPTVTFLQIPSLPTTATPEPATWAFLVAGLSAVSGLAYWQRRKRAA